MAAPSRASRRSMPRGTALVWMLAAIALARRCRPSRRAFSVGAIVLGPDGRVLGRGFSRESGPDAHAEEVALSRAGSSLPRGCVLFSSMEPCGQRRSGRRSCVDRIRAAGIRVVYTAAAEPPVFVKPAGFSRLKRARIRSIRLEELAADAMEPNAHLPKARRDVRSRGRRARAGAGTRKPRSSS